MTKLKQGKSIMKITPKMIKVFMHFWITESIIDKWARSKKIFFILAMGRSGTKFLATLLNEAPDGYVVHEPVWEDFPAYVDAFYNPQKAKWYIKKFRLIRDSRDVVRSLMSRKTMTSQDPVTSKIYPLPDDPWYDKWQIMNRFEKICWYWQMENKFLREHIPKRIHFEKILEDYDYFKENLLSPLGLDIPIEIWEKHTQKKINPSSKYILPHWKEWDKELLEKFYRICGEEMIKNGYQI